MRIQNIEGQFGLINVHPSDTVLHLPLWLTLQAQGRQPRTIRHVLHGGNGLQPGENRLAEETAKWAIDQGINTLVVPAGDNPEHQAAAYIGRRAAQLVGHVGLLELVMPPAPSPIERFRNPAGTRSPAQPLTADDIILRRPRIAHRPAKDPTYLWTPPDARVKRLPIPLGAP